MAEQNGQGGFTGRIANLVAYKRRDSDKTFLRSLPDIPKNRFREAPSFEPVRQNTSEFGGRSTASRFIRNVLDPLQAVVDYNLAPVVAGKVTSLQQMDTEGEKGKRSVQLSKDPGLMDGFQLNKKMSFDSVIRAPVEYRLSRESRLAGVALPSLKPGHNFFPQKSFAHFRMLLSFGIVPDLVWTPKGYIPNPGVYVYRKQTWESPWQSTALGMDAQQITLAFEKDPGDPAYTLLLAIAISYGKPVAPEVIEPVKYVGAGKVLKGT